MSSLWTPGGEVPVSRESQASQKSSSDQSDQGFPPEFGDIDPESLTPEQREQLQAAAQEMARVRAEVLQTPAVEVIANHLMGFFELGAIHLSQETPNFAQATIAIDSLDAVVSALGDRLGEHQETLESALAQIKMAFVQLKERANNPSASS